MNASLCGNFLPRLPRLSTTDKKTFVVCTDNLARIGTCPFQVALRTHRFGLYHISKSSALLFRLVAVLPEGLSVCR